MADTDRCFLNDMLLHANCEQISETKAELDLTMAVTAPLPAYFYLANIPHLIERASELEPVQRRKEIHARLVIALYSKENTGDVPLLQKMHAKERGRPTRAVETMLLEMAVIVSTAISRTTGSKRIETAFTLLRQCEETIGRVENTICLDLESLRLQVCNDDGSTKTIVLKPSTGPEWLKIAVNDVYLTLLPHMGNDKEELVVLCKRFRCALKQVCEATAMAAHFIRKMIAKKKQARRVDKMAGEKTPIKRDREDSAPEGVLPPRRKIKF